VPESMREPRLLALEQDYKYIISYTREDLKEELIEVAEAASLEEVCMISFLPMETNRSLRLLLDASFEGKGELAEPEPVAAVVALTFVPKEQIPVRTKSSNGEIGTRT
jgi:hypothetical protein